MIRELTIRNFKAFDSMSIEFRPLTLLSGLNGSGKSTVLQALAVLRQSRDAGCLKRDQGLLLNSDLVELGTGRDVLFEHADGQNISFDLLEDDLSQGWVFRYSEQNDLLDLVSEEPESCSPNGLLNQPFQFLRADRIAPSVMFPKSYSDAVRNRFLGTRGQYAVHYLAVHQDDSVSVTRRRGSGLSLLSQVEAWLSDLSPGIGVVVREVAGADLAQLSFIYGGRAGIDSSNEYRPTNVGFGLTYCLPIVVACLSASPGDLVLLENPEAHLHPRGQSAMGELLCAAARDGVQLVVETHSDHLLNGVRNSVKCGRLDAKDVALHFFSRGDSGSGSGRVSPVLDSSGRLDQWPEGFFDEWDRAVLELI